MLVELLDKEPAFGPALSRFVSAKSAGGGTSLPTKQPISLAVEHSPSFLAGKAAAAEQSRYFVWRKDDEIAGAASLLTYSGYRPAAGSIQTIGILGNLRIDSSAAAGAQAAVLLSGIRELSRIDAGITLLASVLCENRAALASFSRRRRCGLLFSEIARYHTFILPARSFGRKRDLLAAAPAVVRPCSAADIQALAVFLNREGSKKEFYPSYEPEHFSGETERFPGLKPADILIAERDGRIVGSLGLWDQSPARRWFVNGYSGAVRLLRPLHNARASWFGGISLPPPQTIFPYRAAVCIAAEENNPQIFSLLTAAAQEACTALPERPALVAGLAAADPLCGPAARAAGWSFASELFHLQVKNSARGGAERLDLGAVPYLEVGAL